MPVPTRRLLLLALAGLIPIALAQSYNVALAVAIVWFAAIVILGAVDAHFAPSREHLIWSREHEDKLSLGEWNRVRVTLQNRTRRAIRVLARDAVPWQLTVEGNQAGGDCPGASTWTMEYQVFPIHRGRYTLGPIVWRVLGPLGLAWRQSSGPTGPVKVYPNLLAIRKYDVLLHRAQLQELGMRNTRQWGSGTEFERLRDYTPDDEYRRINWPATARRHRPVAIDYETERNQNIVLLLDTGRLMAARLPPDERLDGRQGTALTRLDYAVNAGLLLAYAALQYDDRAALIAFNDHITRSVTAGRGRRHFLTLLEALYDLEPEAIEVDFANALAYTGTRATRRSLIVLFTDIVPESDTTALVAHLSRLARRHLLLLVTLRDPAVERLAHLRPADSVSVYERSVAMSVLHERERLTRDLQRRGVMTLDVTADALSPSLINRYLDIKARSRL